MEANKRIDAGIKRGPRGPRTGRRPLRAGLPTNPSDPRDLGTWKIPANLDPDHVLDQYLAAETTGDIASQFGLSRKALVKWLRQVRPTQWKEVQLIRAHVRLDDGEDGIEVSLDALSLARAREQVKAAQFRLQSLDPDYQPKQSITVHPGAPVAPELLANAIELLGQIRNPNQVIEQSNLEETKEEKP